MSTQRFCHWYRKGTRSVLLGLILSCALAQVQAEVRLPGLFSDHMVLQQGAAVPVWGWADDGEAIRIEIQGQTARTTCRDGQWKVSLKPLEAGGPFTLKVSGNNTIEIKEVLVGEVWVCSGQSNMEWPMTRSHDPQADIAASANPKLRLFTVPKTKADAPLQDVKARWRECAPETVAGFSAVGYYFGSALQKARNVPVGLIHTSWGGSPAEVWMSQAMLESHPRYQKEILDSFTAQRKRFEEELAAWEKENQALEKEGKKPARNRPWTPWKPTELFNGMIAPLLPYAIAGAVWYQGESNASRAEQYQSLFADMIRNWRQDWGQGSFPFLAVQLAPWDKNRQRTLEQITEAPGESDWAELREAQNLAARLLPQVAVVVITDAGDKDDIHPSRKAPVGERLALAARAIAYQERVEHSGPVYQGIRIVGDKAIVSFTHARGGLVAKNGTLTGFAICGPDRKFVWAEAEIQGRNVIVSSPQVAHPVAVRYGWSDYPVVNLYNKAGLPASPFRTDDFPMITAPKRK